MRLLAIVSAASFALLPVIVFAEENIPFQQGGGMMRQFPDGQQGMMQNQGGQFGQGSQGGGGGDNFRGGDMGRGMQGQQGGFQQGQGGDGGNFQDRNFQPPMNDGGRNMPGGLKTDGLQGVFDAIKRGGGDAASRPQQTQSGNGGMMNVDIRNNRTNMMGTTTDAINKIMRDPSVLKMMNNNEVESVGNSLGGNNGRQSQGQQSLAGMQQGAAGLSQALKNINSQITRLKKKNVQIPPAIQSAIDGAQKDFDTIKNATEVTDEVQAALDNLMDDGQSLRDVGPQLGMLANWPQMEKEANKQIASVQKQLASGKTAAAKANVDVTAIVAEINESITKVQSALAEAKQSVGSADTDPQDFMSSMRDDVLGPLQDLIKQVGVLKDIANVSRAITRVVKHADSLAKSVATLKKAGKDTSALEGLIATIRQNTDEAKQKYTDPSLDSSEIFDLISAAESAGNDADQALAELRGIKTNLDRTMNGESNGAAAYLSNFFSSIFGW